MNPAQDFRPVRACLFDMDGLILDTEDIYTLCVDIVLKKYGRPPLPWSIKAKLQGRPGPAAAAIFHEWANLPISHAEFDAEYAELHKQYFPRAKPLPGVVQLLRNLGQTKKFDDPDTRKSDTSGPSPPHRVHLALATSSTTVNFHLKTAHLGHLFSVFEANQRVLGDDPRVKPGRGKPLPDIYLLALKTINDGLKSEEEPIKPEECLVFEDSIPGVEAGRRAGMRVVWCPHPKLKQEFQGREKEILAGRMGEATDGHVGEHDDGWAEYLLSLADFDYGKYGIKI